MGGIMEIKIEQYEGVYLVHGKGVYISCKTQEEAESAAQFIKKLMG